MPDPSSLGALYARLKALARSQLDSEGVSNLIAEITSASHDFLGRSAEVVELRSLVSGKQYFSFRLDNLSRPINSALYIPDRAEMQARLQLVAAGHLGHLQSAEATRTLYTMAMAFCAAIDSSKHGDKKTPATYFEILIGHVLAVHLGVTPTNSIEVLSGDLKGGTLPTDFIFDLGPQQTKIHLPVKLSTRERAIQVWAHQRIVDGIYGAGRYKGVLVVLAETKLDKNRLEVVEICLPDQWKVYQMYVAQLARIYYFDVPARYAELVNGYPKIDVKPFGQFFSEAERL